jgi:hypothetical protein
MYNVVLGKRASNNVEKIPLRDIQIKLLKLMKDLRDKGAVQSNWANYGKLDKNRHHCHLNYHYVAVWREQKREATEPDEYDPNIEIFITYVGSRENAPY